MRTEVLLGASPCLTVSCTCEATAAGSEREQGMRAPWSGTGGGRGGGGATEPGMALGGVPKGGAPEGGPPEGGGGGGGGAGGREDAAPMLREPDPGGGGGRGMPIPRVPPPCGRSEPAPARGPDRQRAARRDKSMAEGLLRASSEEGAHGGRPRRCLVRNTWNGTGTTTRWLHGGSD